MIQDYELVPILEYCFLTYPATADLYRESVPERLAKMVLEERDTEGFSSLSYDQKHLFYQKAFDHLVQLFVLLEYWGGPHNFYRIADFCDYILFFEMEERKNV